MAEIWSGGNLPAKVSSLCMMPSYLVYIMLGKVFQNILPEAEHFSALLFPL